MNFNKFLGFFGWCKRLLCSLPMHTWWRQSGLWGTVSKKNHIGDI